MGLKRKGKSKRRMTRGRWRRQRRKKVNSRITTIKITTRVKRTNSQVKIICKTKTKATNMSKSKDMLKRIKQMKIN